MHGTSFLTTFFTLLALSVTTPLNLFHFPSPKSFLANAQSTSSGNMTLYRDDLGFYIYAYNTPDSSNNSPKSNGIPMMLGLYTSRTSLMANCLNFASYNCSPKTCDSIPDSKARQEYPFFTAKGYEASALLYLDHEYWSLDKFAFLATSCKSNASAAFGSSRYGIIGMGVALLENGNYLSDITFAVSIAPDLWSGELTFLSYFTQINREQATQSLVADGNWRIPHYYESVIQMGNFYTTANFMVFFDLGADTLGLPHSLFEQLMEYFREEVFLDCTHAFSRPQCDYNGLIEDLPNITISLQNSTIVIPPAIYVQNASNITGVVDLVTLNLRALGEHLTGDSYAVPGYTDNIIFDINFMSYYYVVFNLTTNHTSLITLYLNKEKHNADPKDYSVYILFGCIGFIVLMAVVYCVFRCCQKKKYSKISQTNTNGALINKDITLIHRGLQSESSVRHVDEPEIERG